MKRYHVFVEGRVQGVGFRTFCTVKAQRYHLTGSVRNLENGMVELYIQGEDPQITAFLAFPGISLKMRLSPDITHAFFISAEAVGIYPSGNPSSRIYASSSKNRACAPAPGPEITVHSLALLLFLMF